MLGSRKSNPTVGLGRCARQAHKARIHSRIPATPIHYVVTLLPWQDDDGSEGEEKEEEETEDPIAALEVLESADETDPIYLLYPPLALRTPRQKRTQIVLLGELVLDVQRAFNRHLDRLHSAKEDCMDKARNSDIVMP